MTLRARILALGFVLVALIALSANALVRPELLQGFLPGASEGLSVSLPGQSTALEYGTQAEVLRFKLEGRDFTLRYMTVQVESSGLTVPEQATDWKVYPFEGGRVNVKEPVGYGEALQDGFLRLRFEGEGGVGYSQKGARTFALVTSVLGGEGAADDAGEAFLKASVPAQVPNGFDWSFVLGRVTRPWMDVNSTLGVSAVEGLGLEHRRL